MSDTLIREFRTLLAERFGWRLDDGEQLAQVLSSRLERTQTPDAYLAALRRASASSHEVRALAEALAVSETYFFRNQEQFAVLSEVALPALTTIRGQRPIRILSAGSASGEEAFSIAMCVLEARRAGVAVPAVEILGLDVSRRAIAKARARSYSAWALRGMPDRLRDTYFQPDGRRFVLRPEVGDMVRFEERNLLDVRTAAPGPWDVVFFRNTFMYFTHDVARDILAGLAEAMPAGAFLFLGHAETLRGLSNAFSLQQRHDAFYYVRAAVAATAAWPSVVAEIAAPVPDPPALSDDWVREIAAASDRVAALVDCRPKPVKMTEAGARSISPERLADALALLASERHDEALASLGDGTGPGVLLMKSVLLANMGRIDEARRMCAAVLASDSLHAGAYYVLALCEERAGDDARAVASDETAIYLDSTFAMPHLHLALIATRRGDRATATRHLRRAHELFVGEADLRILLFGGGFSRRALLQLCALHLQSLAS